MLTAIVIYVTRCSTFVLYRSMSTRKQTETLHLLFSQRLSESDVQSIPAEDGYGVSDLLKMCV